MGEGERPRGHCHPQGHQGVGAGHSGHPVHQCPHHSVVSSTRTQGGITGAKLGGTLTPTTSTLTNTPTCTNARASAFALRATARDWDCSADF